MNIDSGGEEKNMPSHQIQVGAVAYVRNLAVAEDAVQKGQFNIAKVLRAAVHTQRILAMGAARLMAGKTDKTNLLEVISKELKNGDSSSIFEALTEEQSEYQKKLKQFNVVREKLTEILGRSLNSLRSNYDVQESDVNQFIWGCYSCGYLVEGDPPDACKVCGALGVEFEWFGHSMPQLQNIWVNCHHRKCLRYLNLYQRKYLMPFQGLMIQYSVKNLPGRNGV